MRGVEPTDNRAIQPTSAMNTSEANSTPERMIEFDLIKWIDKELLNPNPQSLERFERDENFAPTIEEATQLTSNPEKYEQSLATQSSQNVAEEEFASTRQEPGVGQIEQEPNSFGSQTEQEPISFGGLTQQEPVSFGGQTQQEPVSFGGQTQQEPISLGDLTQQEPISFCGLTQQEPISFCGQTRQEPIFRGSEAHMGAPIQPGGPQTQQGPRNISTMSADDSFPELLEELVKFHAERGYQYIPPPGTTPVFHVKEDQKSIVMLKTNDKTYITVKPEKAITFELKGCEVGQEIILTLHYTAQDAKLQAVRPCKLHEGGKKGDIPPESAIMLTSHIGHFSMKGDHSYITLRIDKVDHNSSFVFSLASLCNSSCHANAGKETELTLQLVKGSNMVVENSFVMYFYVNLTRDHKNMLKRKGLLPEDSESRKKKARKDPLKVETELSDCSIPGPSQSIPGPSHKQDLVRNESKISPTLILQIHDEYSLYGTRVGNDLKNLDKDTYLKARRMIDNILHEASNGKL